MAKITKVLKHGNKRYQVDLGKVSGKRIRRFVHTKDEATAKLDQIKDERRQLGDAWMDMKVREKWEILETLRDIKKSGATLAEVWQFWKIHHTGGAGVTLSDAITQFLDLKREAGRRPLYLREAGYGLQRFAQGRDERDLASISINEVQGWLAQLEASQATKATLQSRLNSLFSWAVRQGYLDSNPIGRMEKVSVTKADPQILTNDQCTKLLAASSQDYGMLEYLALSLFCGIRPEECMRLDHEAIDTERMQIVISGETAKTRNRRIVTITEPALKILSKHRTHDYKVNFRKRLAAIRKIAKLKKWPKDVLRHTAASHFYNIYGIQTATEQLGHSADVMLKHYRQLVSKEDTQAWLEI
jgi:integrase